MWRATAAAATRQPGATRLRAAGELSLGNVLMTIVTSSNPYYAMISRYCRFDFSPG
jgi:hypothetical protein